MASEQFKGGEIGGEGGREETTNHQCISGRERAREDTCVAGGGRGDGLEELVREGSGGGSRSAYGGRERLGIFS